MQKAKVCKRQKWKGAQREEKANKERKKRKLWFLNAWDMELLRIVKK